MSIPKGFNVQAVFMKNWDATDETGFCSIENDWKDAQMVCDKLKIPIHKVDFVKQYWIDVFGYVFSPRAVSEWLSNMK